MGKVWGEGVQGSLGRILWINPSRWKSSHNNSKQARFQYRALKGKEVWSRKLAIHEISCFREIHPETPLIQGGIKTKIYSCIVNALQCSVGGYGQMVYLDHLWGETFLPQDGQAPLQKFPYSRALPRHWEIEEISALKYKALGRFLHLLSSNICSQMTHNKMLLRDCGCCWSTLTFCPYIWDPFYKSIK